MSECRREEKGNGWRAGVGEKEKNNPFTAAVYYAMLWCTNEINNTTLWYYNIIYSTVMVVARRRIGTLLQYFAPIKSHLRLALYDDAWVLCAIVYYYYTPV